MKPSRTPDLEDARRRRERRRIGQCRLIRIEDDDGSFDREFWSRVPPSERMAMVWDMVLEEMERRGELNGVEPRLQRSVCRVERRGG